MSKFEFNGQKNEVLSVDFLVPIAVKVKTEIGEQVFTGKLDCVKKTFFADNNMSGEFQKAFERAINEFIQNRDAIDPDSYISTDPSDYDLKDTIKRNINERSI